MWLGSELEEGIDNNDDCKTLTISYHGNEITCNPLNVLMTQ